jgi:hypothetical protein
MPVDEGDERLDPGRHALALRHERADVRRRQLGLMLIGLVDRVRGY